MSDAPSPLPLTMKDIAALADCSVNTVSLALRDSPRISAKRRARIQRLAREHGYRPNPLVSAFVTSRRRAAPTQTLAVLTKFNYPLFENLHRTDLFSAELLAGLRHQADELGFRLEEFPVNLPGSPDGHTLTRVLLARGIRGVLLFPSGDLSMAFPELDWTHFAVVAAGFHSKHLPVHRTAMDQGRAVETCIARLQARGLRRIALGVTRQLDPRWNYTASGRFFAWQCGQPLKDRVPVIPGDHEHPLPHEVNKWLQRYRPDAVIGYQYYPEYAADLARDHDHEVLAVVIEATERTDCYRLDPQLRHLGRTSVNVLARELFINHYGLPAIPEVTFISGLWLEPGQTAAARPAAKLATTAPLAP